MWREEKTEATQINSNMEIKNVGQLLVHFAQKAGISSEDENLKNILSNAELTKVPIHSDLARQMDDALLSVEMAKDNHPDIGTVYKAQALNALDKKLAALADELGMNDELDGIKNTYKKLDIVVDKLKAAKAAKPAANDGLQKQNEELLKELQTIKANSEAERQKNEADRINDKKGFVLRGEFNGRKTILDELDPEVRQDSLNLALARRLNELDAELLFDESGKVLQPFKKDGSKLLGPNHTPITLQALLDSVIAQNKLDVVTPPPTPPIPGAPGDRVPGREVSGNNASVGEYARQQRLAYAENAQ